MEADYRDETIQSFAKNILRLGNECRALAEDNARLKAEIEMMKASSRGHSTSHLYQQMAEENARLKAEVERMTAFTTRTIIPNEELQKQVERLKKAGDKMAHIHRFVGFPSYTLEWEAAKEGKQSND